MPKYYNFLDEPSPDKLDPDAIACGNCTGFVAAKRANGKFGVCIRERPKPLINRFVMKVAPPANPLLPNAAPVNYMEGAPDGFFTQTAWHWRCDPGPGANGFIRRGTNGAAASLGDLPALPPLPPVGHVDPVEGLPAAAEAEEPSGPMQPMEPSDETTH